MHVIEKIRELQMVEIEQTRASACCAWALDRRARGPSHVQPSRVGSSSHLPGDVSVDACDALDAVPRELFDPLLLHRRMPSPLEPTHRELLEVGPLPRRQLLHLWVGAVRVLLVADHLDDMRSELFI